MCQGLSEGRDGSHKEFLNHLDTFVKNMVSKSRPKLQRVQSGGRKTAEEPVDREQGKKEIEQK